MSSGKVVSWKCAQCGQVIEAYSITVTDALSLPITISGNLSGFINSRSETVSAASAMPSRDGSADTPTTARLNATVAVLWQNSRRVMRNGNSWNETVWNKLSASWIGQLWQWRAILPREDAFKVADLG
ncbi:MAG: hypothetical protein WDN48_05075 [Pseudolabrys sp.]